MSNNTLYNRKALVRIYPAIVSTPGDPSYYSRVTTVTALDITSLRVQFEIVKSIDKEVNTCKINITNLNETNRKAIENTKPLIIELYAGYDPDNIFTLPAVAPLQHLFAGDVRFAFSKLKSPDWDTEVDVADGDRAFKYARVSHSFASHTTIAEAVRFAAATMGIGCPEDILNNNDFLAQFPAGHAMYGATQQELTNLLTPLGYSWSTQHGKLKIYRDDQTRTTQAWVISRDTGMIGSPEFEVPAKTKKPIKLRVKTVLRPELEAGGWIEVDSRDIPKKQFRIHKITHKGDTHSRETWYTQIEARAA